MTHRVVVTGSTAIDQTGFYGGSFRDYQNDYNVEALNASVTLSGVRTSFGGCAPNISYGLHLLGVEALPLSSAGRDFRNQYEAHLRDLGISTDYIYVDEQVPHSATCLMLNDGVGNQVIGFYPGPVDPKRHAPAEISGIDQVDLAILGPEIPTLTLRQGRAFAALNIPILVDPGQVIPEFNADDIRELLSLADYLVLNDHEFTVLKTNGLLTNQEVFSSVPEVVITHGGAGVDVYKDGDRQHIDAVANVEIVEVTGCGDAFRAGYAFGILEQLPHRQRAQLGCIMAMKNLQVTETQKYTMSAAELAALNAQYYSQGS